MADSGKSPEDYSEQGQVRTRASVGRAFEFNLDQLPCGLLLVAPNGCIRYASRCAHALLRSETLIEEVLSDVLPGVELEGDDDEGSEQLVVLRGDNEAPRILACHCSPAVVSDGGGRLVSLHDLTELQGLRKDVVRLDRLAELGRLTSAITHDIRNPLAGMKAMISALVFGAESEALRESLDQLESATDRLINLLRAFSQLTRHRPPRRRPCKLVGVVAAAQRECGEILNDHQVITQLGDVPELVHVDPIQMQQVLRHLLLNAAQASDEGQAIAVRAHTEQDVLVIEVSDSGRGMAPADQQKAQEALYSTSRRPGLGLTVCSRIVKDHGGSLQLKSEEGEGTTVGLRIPYAIDHDER